ncbi:MAG: Wzz/FepE/Etk N-terminal domain-containing protein, partial [Muribaculaceae bacterium]
MQNQDTNLVEKEEVNTGISMRDFFEACFHYWYWFVLSIIVCAGLAFFFAKSQTQKYKVTGLVLIKSDDKNGKIPDNALFSDLGLGNPGQAVENEMYVLQSTSLFEQVISQIGADIIYMEKPLLRYVNLYKKSPIKMTYLSKRPKNGVAMEITINSASEYEYRFPNSDNDNWRKATFGNKVAVAEGVFILNKTANFNNKSQEKTLYVDILTPYDRVKKMSNDFSVKKADKETTVLSLQLEGDNNDMIKDILNGL